MAAVLNKSLLLVVIACGAQAQPWSTFLDPSRAIDWSLAANRAGFTIPSYTVTCVTQPTLTAGSAAAATNTSTIQGALNSCDATHNVVSIPAGTWYVAGLTFGTQGHQVLRGAGPKSTTLVMTAETTCGGLNHAICMINANTVYNGSTAVLPPGGTQQCLWTAGYTKGSTSITLNTCPGGAPPLNQLLILDQANDTTDTAGVFICDSTMAGCTGEAGAVDGRTISGVTHSLQQVVLVTAVTGTGTGPFSVTITPGLYANNLRTGQAPGAWWPGTVQNDGLENMTVDGTAAPDGTLSMYSCYQCWERNVRSLNAGRNHVLAYQSMNSLIRDSYFFGSQTSAAESYGFESEESSATLIENNIFQQVTAPIMFGQGAGSAVTYNFQANSSYGGAAFQGAYYGHSAGSVMGLWEGNNFLAIVTDAVHGSTATPTYFRNMLRSWQTGKTYGTMPVPVRSWHRGFNVVGNVLGQPGYHTNYEAYATSSTGGVNTGLSNSSIYTLGFSDYGGLGICVSNGGQQVACDPLSRSTLMRWGNWDVVNAAVQWNTTEASPAAVTYIAANFTTTYFSTLAHTLPASLYYSSTPSWWPASKAWPPIGPDVTTGNVGLCSGGAYAGAQATAASQCSSGGGTLTSPATAYQSHVVSIPAQDCYYNLGGPPDGTGSALAYDIATCATTATRPAPPTTLTVTIQ